MFSRFKKAVREPYAVVIRFEGRTYALKAGDTFTVVPTITMIPGGDFSGQLTMNKTFPLEILEIK